MALKRISGKHRAAAGRDRRRVTGCLTEPEPTPPSPRCGCGCGCEDLPVFLDLTRDSLEILVVVLLRHVMASCCMPQAAVLDEALDCAEAMLGLAEGPLVFSHVLALVRALRRDRSADFLFMPARSEQVCEDEQEMLALLQAARRKDIELSGSLAASLARGDATSRILPAMQRLSEVLDRHVAARRQPAATPDWAEAAGTWH